MDLYVAAVQCVGDVWRGNHGGKYMMGLEWCFPADWPTSSRILCGNTQLLQDS